jgi:hypothetical protein
VWVLGHDVRIWSPSLVNVVALFYKDKARFARALEKKKDTWSECARSGLAGTLTS